MQPPLYLGPDHLSVRGMGHVKLLGLSLGKWKQWREVLREERRGLGWRDWIGMVWLGLMLPFRVDRKQWRGRLRVCRKCPIYDRGLRRCRPFTGANVGCGCWMPLKAMTGPCWAREAIPDGELGWPKELQ